MSIVSAPSGNFTPGALATLTYSAAVINAAWEQANTKYADFETKIGNITDQSTGWLSTLTSPHVTAGTVATPTVVEPAVDIPATQSADDVMTLFDTKYAELVTMLSDKFVSFRTTYFPNDAAEYAAVETWIQGAVANPNGGLPVAVQQQITADDQARVLSDTTRASDAVLQAFAARRFPLPPGAAASAVLQIQQKSQDAMAESSRKITMASVDMMKFAVEKSVGLRQMAMNDAIEYVKAIASAPEMASRLVGIGYDAQSKLISAASQFYSARTDVQKLISSVGEFNVTTGLEVASKNQAADLTLIEDRLKALLTECQAIAQMATSLFNNLHASAGTSYSASA
jgi:hypothetical protein